MLGEAWKTSEGSIPSIGLGREHSWTPYSFLLHFLMLSTRPNSYPMLDFEAVRYRLSGIAHYKIRKAL